MSLDAELRSALERLHRLLGVGRVGAAGRYVESLKRTHGPTIWVEARNRYRNATKWMQGRPGVAWFPVETQAPTDGHSGGLVRVEVSFDSSPGDAFPAHERATWLAALSVGLRAAGNQCAPERVRVRFSPDIGGRDRLRVEGRSAELALAIAAYGAASGRLPPEGVAFTGAVHAHDTGVDGRLEAPESASLAEKLACLRDDWTPEARLITGPGARPGVEPYDRFSAVIAALARVDGTQSDPTVTGVDALQGLVDAERAGRYVEAMEMAESLWAGRDEFARASDGFRVALEGIRLSNHLARSRDYDLWRGRARNAQSLAEPSQAAALAANVAVREIDWGRPDAAIDCLETALTALPMRPAPDLDRVYLLGTLARAWSAFGDHDRAVEFGDLALAFAPFAERPRNNGDAALWRLRAGRASDALETLDAGEPEVDDVAKDYDVALTRGFRALTRTRALIAVGRLEDATAARNEVLRAPRNIVLTLGAAETGLALGAPLDASLDTLDLTHPVVSRLRARIEYARPDGDLTAASQLARGLTPEELHLRVPY